jgi:hypothetical protein
MDYFIANTTLEEIQLPEIVYKYRDWNNPLHKRVITHQEIYFAAPLDCQEQHECNLPRDYAYITDDIAYKYYYATSPLHGYVTHEQRDRIAREMVKLKPYSDVKHREYIEQLFRKRLNETLSIFCVCPFRDNLNLWETFADDQTGFCVGFDARELLRVEQLAGSGGNIKYYPTGNPPLIKPIHFSEEERLIDMIDVVYSLPDIYSEEKEYRFAKSHLATKEIPLPRNCFKEIVLGNSMRAEEVDSIVALIRQHLSACKILQAKSNISTGEFTFVEIA